MTTSAAVGDAELHGEVAGFRVPPDVFEDDSRLVWKAVFGGSYRLPFGSGILAYAEYHYSGFGAAHPGDILRMLSSPDFRERYLRGDTQILSRHALALTGSYEASPEFTYAGQWVHNPKDRSGIVTQRDVYAERPRIAPRDRVHSVRSGASRAGLSERIRHLAALCPAATTNLSLRVPRPRHKGGSHGEGAGVRCGVAGTVRGSCHSGEGRSQAGGFWCADRDRPACRLSRKTRPEFRPYVILGACNPPLAFTAVTADPEVGLLLPCNVVVESTGEGSTLVRLTNPEALLGSAALAEASELATVARDARDRMARVAQTLATRSRSN